MRSKYVTYVTLLALSSSLFTFAVGTGANNELREQRQEERQEEKQERIQNRCEISENRVDGVISTYESNHESWSNLITNTEEVLTKIAEKLEERGANVTNLRSYISTLKTMMQTAADSKETVIAKLQEAKGLACGESQGEYKAHLQEARQLRQTLVENRRAAREYFINTVKPEIKSLRGALQAARPDSGTEESDSTEQ